MKRGVWIGVFAVLAFTTILIVRLPARWLAGALPADIACAQISGTIWNGTCSGLVVRNAAIGDLNWQLHPSQLLTRQLATRVVFNGPAGSATAEVTASSGGRIAARDLRASLTLDPALLPQAPPNLRGKIRTDLSQLRIENGRIASLEGRIDVHDLKDRGSQSRTLGDYVLTFPAARTISRDGEPVGDVRSVKGPFAVEATLRFTREPGFELEGLISAGAGAPPEVLQQLGYLGTPDAQGRRSFSVAGTF